MKISDLIYFLETFDNLNNNTPLEARQQAVIQNMRMLTKGSHDKDITQAITALVRPFASTSIPWESKTPFQKLTSTLSGEVDSSLFLPPSKTDEAKQWLIQMVQQVQNTLGGSFTLQEKPLTLTFQGPLTMKYSIFLALVSAGVVAKTSFLDVHHIDEAITLTINEDELIKTMNLSASLSFVKLSLQQMGLLVEMGGKTCRQSLSQNDAYKSRNQDELKTAYAMSLEVADALNNMPDAPLVFPLTLKISITDNELMELLESYYRHPMVNLRSRDGKVKTFIEETRAPGQVHESVLNFNQLNALRDFFDRLAYFSNFYHKPASLLFENEITQATQQIYKQINDQLATLTVSPNSFEVESFESNRYTETMSIHQFELNSAIICNKNLIPGPRIYLEDTAFIQRFNRIQASIFKTDSYTSWPTFIESYRCDSNCTTPKSPVPMKYYAAAIARFALENRKVQIGSTPEDHRLGLEWLGKTVSRSTYGSSADQHYYDFYTENNAYYLIDSLVSCIKSCLDHPNCTEEDVQTILQLLGVSSSSMASLKNSLGGEQHFNRFQIKLFLLPLVLNGLFKENLLMNIQSLSQRQDRWVASNVPGRSTTYTASTAEWYKAMRDWKNCEIDGINWIVGGAPQTSQQRSNQQTGHQDNSIFAGGARADAERQQQREEQIQNHVNYGSGG